MKRNRLLSLVTLSFFFGGASLLADTLYLKNGQSVEGTYLGGTSSSIRFRSESTTRSYPVSEVEQLDFTQGVTTTSSSMSRERFVTFENSVLRIEHPQSWQVSRDGDAVTIAPSSGRKSERGGAMSLVTGVIMELTRPPDSSYIQGLTSRELSVGTLEEETDRIFADLRQSNPNMRASGSRQEITVDGQRALRMRLTNDSPAGGRESDWLVTMKHPQGILYMVFVAPEREFHSYEGVFQQMLNSVRLAR
ncbi:MAG: hypothetical protein HY648_03665 [Acidobacteria bacterium]|nr:hypothetical protein [Acidobacteriota bacterium]